VRASHDALVELLESLKDFFLYLGVYTQIPLTAEMAEVLVKIVAEIFSIFSIATKEVKRTRASELFAQDILYLGRLLCLIRNRFHQTVGKDRHRGLVDKHK
jgi:hypothetical protein